VQIDIFFFARIFLLYIQMVKLTAELIAKQAPGHNKRRADESVEHYLARLTHLPFQNRGIDSIVNEKSSKTKLIGFFSFQRIQFRRVVCSLSSIYMII